MSLPIYTFAFSHHISPTILISQTNRISLPNGSITIEYIIDDIITGDCIITDSSNIFSNIAYVKRKIISNNNGVVKGEFLFFI